MRRWLKRIPGPTWLKVVVGVAVAIAALVGLFFLYDWVGTSLLDTGGAIG
jgi:hypothetical protein